MQGDFQLAIATLSSLIQPKNYGKLFVVTQIFYKGRNERLSIIFAMIEGINVHEREKSASEPL